MRRDEKRLRRLCGAALGAVYACLIYFPRTEIFFTLVSKLIFSSVICMTAFKLHRGWSELAKLTAAFLAVCFVFGGGVNAVYYLAGPIYGLKINNGVAYLDVPLGLFLASVAGCYAGLRLLSLVFAGRHSGGIYAVTVTLGGVSAETTAVIDTGNSLTEPAGNLPVIVSDYNALKRLIPELLKPVFQKGDISAAPLLLKLTDWESRFRLVAFRSVGGGGLLPCFKPDCVILRRNGEEFAVRDAVIGISPGGLGGDCGALLPPALLSGAVRINGPGETKHDGRTVPADGVSAGAEKGGNVSYAFPTENKRRH